MSSLYNKTIRLMLYVQIWAVGVICTQRQIINKKHEHHSGVLELYITNCLKAPFAVSAKFSPPLRQVPPCADPILCFLIAGPATELNFQSIPRRIKPQTLWRRIQHKMIPQRAEETYVLCVL